MGKGNAWCLWCERRRPFDSKKCVAAQFILDDASLWPKTHHDILLTSWHDKAPTFKAICCRTCIEQLRNPYLVAQKDGSVVKAFVRPSRLIKDAQGRGIPGLFTASYFPKGTQLLYGGKLVSAEALKALEVEQGVSISLLWAKGASRAIGYGVIIGQLTRSSSDTYSLGHRVNTKRKGDKFKTNAHWGLHKMTVADIQNLGFDPAIVTEGCQFPCITIGNDGLDPGHEILVNTYGSAYWTRTVPRETRGFPGGSVWWPHRFLTPQAEGFLLAYDASRNGRSMSRSSDEEKERRGKKRRASSQVLPSTKKSKRE